MPRHRMVRPQLPNTWLLDSTAAAVLPAACLHACASKKVTPADSEAGSMAWPDVCSAGSAQSAHTHTGLTLVQEAAPRGAGGARDGHEGKHGAPQREEDGTVALPRGCHSCVVTPGNAL